MKPLRLIFALLVLLGLTVLVYTGAWHTITLFVWQHPMLSWMPILTVFVVSLAFRAAGSLSGRNVGPVAGASSPASAEEHGSVSPVLSEELGSVGAEPAERQRPELPPGAGRRVGITLLSGLAVFLVGLFFTVISPPAVGLEDIEYELVETLPERTQPRLLPRSGVRDDPAFAEAKEIHLARDPESGELVWTGEWQAASLSGASEGVSVKSLDDLVAESEIVQAGFDQSAAAIGPGSLKWKAKLSHPLSRIQYPVLIPTGEREAIAIAPYIGYRGFPFRTPYLKGVLVYHQDGTVEDLTPEEAAEHPQLAASGRIVPEAVAREQAEALAGSEELEGEIVDGEGNTQPFLTAIDAERTAWVTIINEPERAGGVKAIVLADSTTGETEVWRAPDGGGLISTKDVVNAARALPLKWEETRCCDSDGHSYTVTLREVVEPRLAFKNGRPYYMVTVVPTSELALGRAVEYTLLIDPATGDSLDQFAHVEGGRLEDARLERFFR